MSLAQVSPLYTASWLISRPSIPPIYNNHDSCPLPKYPPLYTALWLISRPSIPPIYNTSWFMSLAQVSLLIYRIMINLPSRNSPYL